MKGKSTGMEEGGEWKGTDVAHTASAPKSASVYRHDFSWPPLPVYRKGKTVHRLSVV